jgi:hypothetical protein
VEIKGLGLQLRYTRNGKPFVRRTFTYGPELLRDTPSNGLSWNSEAGRLRSALERL